MKKPKPGKIIEDPRANIRDHERRTARALANSGYTVEFIIASRIDGKKSADVLIDGMIFEIKSPITNKITQIEKNLKKANRQAQNIVIDSQRMKNFPDKKLTEWLKKYFVANKSIKILWQVTHDRKVVKIGERK
ncbi:hypothetical protein FWH58_00160 [Candidatus Saccharibacteria bacterium]|nr:hypothetical protein [Candidatus Saccharibacteria bacterium]